jgi:type I restriction enzyme S subunit
LATKTVAQPKLALTRLAEVELPIPAIEVQNNEVEIFDDLKRKFIKLNDEQQSKLIYLKALKSSLLDRALKGEL